MGGHVAPAWLRHHSRCSLSYAGTICHLHEHLQTQGALVTQCYSSMFGFSIKETWSDSPEHKPIRLAVVVVNQLELQSRIK